MIKPMRHFTRKTLLLTLSIFLLTTLQASASTMTQRVWMITLVDALELSFGLPDEPQDPDYINILLGTRTFRFEAEEVYTPDEDEVSVMDFGTFGQFSGTGWLQGLNKPTNLRLRFTLPLSGDYQLATAVRRGEHRFAAENQELSGSGEERFTRIELGEVNLTSGDQEILVTLATGGAIDYIELTAPTLSPIMPKHGWDPDEPLTWDDIQTSLLQALDLAALLPLSAPPKIMEAERLELPKDSPAAVVQIGHLGKPRSGKWVRTRGQSADLVIPFDARQGGFYSAELRGMGAQLQLTLNDHFTKSIETKPYLEDYSLGPLFFYEGKNRINLRLPPGGGLDWLSLAPLDSSEAVVARMLGFTEGNAPPNQSDIDHFTRILTAFGSPR